MGQHRRITLACLCLLLLAGCDGYPDDWSRLDRAFFSACPDISGTYRIGENNEEGVGRSHNLEGALMFRNILPPRNAPHWHWETMTISGDAREALQVTLMRSATTIEHFKVQLFAKGGMGYYRKQYEDMHSPARRWSGGFAQMTDDEYAANLEKLYVAPVEQHTLRRSKDYDCAGGWITTTRMENDPGPDHSQPRPDTFDGTVRFMRSVDGYLVAEAQHVESHPFYLWCGDGCKGFNLGDWTDHDWRRWEPATPAWQGEVPRPWAAPFVRERYGADSGSHTRQQEVRELVQPLLPADATLAGIEAAGNRDALLSVTSASTTPFTRLIAALEKSYRFTSVQVDALAHDDKGNWQIAIRLGLKPQASATSTADIQLRLLPLLPPQGTLQAIAPQDGGFSVTLRGLTHKQTDALVQAINQSADFRGASTQMFFVGADYTETRIRFFEETADGQDNAGR